MDKGSRLAWERRPDEGDKPYNAFLEYIKMPIRDIEDDTNNRTLANLSRKLGYSVADGKAASTIENWSSKYNWVERAKAYDNHNAQLSIEVRDASLAQYQSEVITRRTVQTTLMNNALDKQIQDLLLRQNAGHPIDPLELLRLTKALQTLDDLERRIAGLPTNYSTEKVDKEVVRETQVFTIGG